VRRLSREQLDAAARVALYKERVKIASGRDARQAWDTFRGRVSFRPVLKALERSAGLRQRCMYCRDSRSCDVDHFVPIAVDPAKTMWWPNLLWVCADCNRRKSARYDVDLLSPFESDPWRHFVFVPISGEISPRWIDPNNEDRCARVTMSILPALQHEAVTEGRRRAYRRIRRAADAWLRSPNDRDLRLDLVTAVREDEFGVAGWFLVHEGGREAPWPDVERTDSMLMRRLRALCW